MKYNYTSFFKQDIINYLNYRISLGHNEETYRALKLLDTFLTKNYNSSSTFTKKMFDEWISSNSNWGNNTLYKMICQISNFCEFVSYKNTNVYVPPKIIAPKTVAYQPCIINDEDVYKIFECIDNYTSPSFSPSYFHIVGPVLFRMLFLCGLRPNEPCQLLCSDVDLSSGKIKISNTKRHKSRQIYMSEDMIKLCRKYNDIIAVIVPDREYFFIKRNGKKLTTANIEYYWNTIRNKLNDEHLSQFRLYDWRHNFATRSILGFLKNENNIYSYMNLLSTYMGHESFDSTLYYISLLPSYLKNQSNIDWANLDQCIPEVTI